MPSNLKSVQGAHGVQDFALVQNPKHKGAIGSALRSIASGFIYMRRFCRQQEAENSSMLLRLPLELRAHIAGFLGMNVQTGHETDVEMQGEELGALLNLVPEANRVLMASPPVDSLIDQLSVKRNLVNQLKSLTVLDLSWCFEITPKVFNALVTSCRSLVSLNLSGCRLLGDSSVNILAMNCPGLNFLNLYRCEQISDKGIRTLAHHCRELYSINLSGCSRLTYRGIKTLLQSCPKLIELNLSDCEQIRGKDVLNLLGRFPRMRIIVNQETEPPSGYGN